eukprot:TRINITY_DN15185_c0_g1_i2.p1 TRINITY_DN15185_c0_g1~~TRINITY_DN15185_c0_g1_i2.p1  ORF type:complete len:731 (+),score=203.88 TRINITY_DN15185_c0_g1_i2:467-2659(+)
MGKPSGNAKKHSESKANGLYAKPKKSKEPNSKAMDEDMTVFINMSQELKEEGNTLFQKRDYDGAMFKYGKALKLLPKNHIDIAYLHSNIAACYMQRGPSEYKEAIEECNMALDVSPKYSKALLKRARCYEALNRLDFALNDVGTVLRFEPNNLMAQEIAERVRKELERKGIQIDDKQILALECKEPACHSPTSTVVKEKTKKKKKQSSKTEDEAVVEEQPKSNEMQSNKAEDKTVVEEQPKSNGKKQSSKAEDKVVVEEQPKSKGKKQSSKAEDKAVVEEQPKATEEIMRSIKLVFGEDIRWAQMPANCSLSELREIVKNRFPSLKAVLIKYKDQEGDLVTITTTEELRWAEACANVQAARFSIVEVDPEQDPLFLHKFENGIEPKKLDGGSSYIDDWIIEFAQLFKNHVGFDSDGYLELHDVGMKFYSEAIEDTITCDDAQNLFDIAADKFQEMAALALFNWGNVHMSRARKRVPLTEDATTESVLAEVRRAYEWAETEYEKAGKKYREALDIKPDFYEGFLALGLQQFELAKLTWHFAVGSKANLDEVSSVRVIDLFEHAHKNIARGTNMWEEMEEQRLSQLSNPDNGENQLKKMGLDGLFKELTTDEAAELAANMRSQINILWGTMIYERSIIEFKLGNDLWEDYLEASIDRFKHAGASQIDIAVMIKSHCSNETAQEGIVFKIDEIVQAWNEMYDAKKWKCGVPSFRLEPLLRLRVPKLHHILEHL